MRRFLQWKPAHMESAKTATGNSRGKASAIPKLIPALTVKNKNE